MFKFTQIAEGIFSVKSTLITGELEHVGTVKRIIIVIDKTNSYMEWEAFMNSTPEKSVGKATSRIQAAKLLV
jgi:hypothetical protein